MSSIHDGSEAGDLLGRAISACDLFDLILEFFPDSDRFPGCFKKLTHARVCAVWRKESSPSVDLSFRRKAGHDLWVDRGTCLGGNAFSFITKVVGFTPKDAANFLIARLGLQGQQPNRTLGVEQRERKKLERDFRAAHRTADPGFLAEFAERRVLGLEPPPDHDSLASLAFAQVGGTGSSTLGVLIKLRSKCDPDEIVLREQIELCITSVLADWICEAIGPYLHAEEGGAA